ncbi:MAG: hypothetical protein KAS72_08675 [Phycisphaerales bacterium]|nr:hypothetical protein [Phycisphaerales bacterium]
MPQPNADQPTLHAPAARLVTGVVITSVAAGVIAYIVALITQPDAAMDAWWATLVVLLSALAGTIFLMTRGSRTIVEWSAAWLAATGIRLAGTVLLAIGAYFLVDPDPLVGALSLTGGYIAVLIVEATILTRALRRAWDARTSAADRVE